MKKKILCLLLLLIMPIFMLCGCSDTIDSAIGTEYTIGDVCLVKVEESDCFCIFVHKETRVMYLANTEQYRYGLTVMLNADGTPMIWEGKLKGE